MTAKFDVFKKALIKLCDEHDVFLFAYEGMEVRDSNGTPYEERQYSALKNISDGTE